MILCCGSELCPSWSTGQLRAPNRQRNCSHSRQHRLSLDSRGIDPVVAYQTSCHVGKRESQPHLRQSFGDRRRSCVPSPTIDGEPWPFAPIAREGGPHSPPEVEACSLRTVEGLESHRCRRKHSAWPLTGKDLVTRTCERACSSLECSAGSPSPV